MDLNDFGNFRLESQRELAAQVFARYVHDEWGVGLETESCGGAGVLLFLSVHQRTIYISRGHALEQHLTDRRLDQVIDNMKGRLRSELYYEAIHRAVNDIQALIEKGPPSYREYFLAFLITHIVPKLRCLMYFCVPIFAVVVQIIAERLIFSRTRKQTKRDYALVASQLYGLDRARAEALQGKYCARSCAVCFGDFRPPAIEGEVATIGSDGQPIKLLKVCISLTAGI